MRSALPVVTIVFCLLAGDLARASEPITIVYARGRNKVAIQLWKQSEDEIDNGNVSAALQHADAALRSDPTLYPALYTRAKCYVRQHKLEAALQDCSSALKQDPTLSKRDFCALPSIRAWATTPPRSRSSIISFPSGPGLTGWPAR